MTLTRRVVEAGKPGAGARVLLLLIALYQRLISPLLGRHCRFEPSCSHYSANAIAKFGALRGSWMAVKRVSRCHPLDAGGFDPVP